MDTIKEEQNNMKTILFFILFYSLTLADVFIPHKEDGILKLGFNIGLDSKSQPAFVISDYYDFNKCFILGDGELKNQKIYVTLHKMSCHKNGFFYEFILNNSYLLDKNRQVGILTQHHNSKNQEILNKYEKLYTMTKDITRLKMIQNAKKGYWSTNPNQKVTIIFGSKPIISKKTSENQVFGFQE